MRRYPIELRLVQCTFIYHSSTALTLLRLRRFLRVRCGVFVSGPGNNDMRVRFYLEQWHLGLLFVSSSDELTYSNARYDTVHTGDSTAGIAGFAGVWLAEPRQIGFFRFTQRDHELIPLAKA